MVSTLQGLLAALASLPPLPSYAAGVETIDSAIAAMPSSTTLTDALAGLGATLTLPPSHAMIINVSTALAAAIEALPERPPFERALGQLTASRAELPGETNPNPSPNSNPSPTSR